SIGWNCRMGTCHSPPSEEPDGGTTDGRGGSNCARGRAANYFGGLCGACVLGFKHGCSREGGGGACLRSLWAEIAPRLALVVDPLPRHLDGVGIGVGLSAVRHVARGAWTWCSRILPPA